MATENRRTEGPTTAPSTASADRSAQERALRHYDRAIEALTGGAYAGLDRRERDALVAMLHRYRAHLLGDVDGSGATR